MAAKVRPYLFYDSATSVCTTCLRRVEAKIIVKDERVYLEKWCALHGRERVLVAEDAAYYRKSREVFIKPPELPQRFNTEQRWGCPYDCGLCPEHMQHSCLTLVEVTDHCNLRCPICYADSGPHRPGFRDLATIERMLDAVVANEGEPDVVQISGGEPTIHPEFFAILEAAKRRPIRHLMVNTNGLRIAKEPGFAKRLAEYQPGFELYLQFDSLRDEVHQALRGARLSDVRRRALDALNEHDVSTTLVVTVKNGLNDHELGEIVEFLKDPGKFQRLARTTHTQVEHRAPAQITCHPHRGALSCRLHRLPGFAEELVRRMRARQVVEQPALVAQISDGLNTPQRLRRRFP